MVVRVVPLVAACAPARVPHEDGHTFIKPCEQPGVFGPLHEPGRRHRLLEQSILPSVFTHAAPVACGPRLAGYEQARKGPGQPLPARSRLLAKDDSASPHITSPPFDDRQETPKSPRRIASCWFRSTPPHPRNPSPREPFDHRAVQHVRDARPPYRINDRNTFSGIGTGVGRAGGATGFFEHLRQSVFEQRGHQRFGQGFRVPETANSMLASIFAFLKHMST